MPDDSLIKTLLVEPCPAARAALAGVLTRCGCDVTPVGRDEDACQSHAAEAHSLAVLGVDRMPDQGFWLCRRLRSVADGADPVILALSERWDEPLRPSSYRHPSRCVLSSKTPSTLIKPR